MGQGIFHMCMGRLWTPGTCHYFHFFIGSRDDLWMRRGYTAGRASAESPFEHSADTSTVLQVDAGFLFGTVNGPDDKQPWAKNDLTPKD